MARQCRNGSLFDCFYIYFYVDSGFYLWLDNAVTGFVFVYLWLDSAVAFFFCKKKKNLGFTYGSTKPEGGFFGFTKKIGGRGFLPWGELILIFGGSAAVRE